MIPYVVIGLFILFQGWVTWRVWTSPIFVRSEKSAQTKLIWLLPLLGSIMVYSVLADEAKHERQSH